MRERKEAEREVVPSLRSCHFMENTELSNIQNNIPLPLTDMAENIRPELY